MVVTVRQGGIEVIESIARLRDLYREPATISTEKEVDFLDENCREFLQVSPFVAVATADGEGNCDVSPRGGPVGFVKTLDDHHLGIPDASGNRRLDSMQNILLNPHVGLMFIVPGLEETLRVNGRAWITADPEVLSLWSGDARPPVSVIVVEMQTAFIHCAKAFKRSHFWHPERWPDRSSMRPVAAMIAGHTKGTVGDEAAVQEILDTSYGQVIEAEKLD